jgi:hypothetical protein
VRELEAAQRRQLQKKAVEGLVKCVCCVSTKQAKNGEGEVMNENYLRDEEYDEPDVRPDERGGPEGWYIAAGLIYICALLMTFVAGWIYGRTP